MLTPEELEKLQHDKLALKPLSDKRMLARVTSLSPERQMYNDFSSVPHPVEEVPIQHQSYPHVLGNWHENRPVRLKFSNVKPELPSLPVIAHNRGRHLL